MEQSPKGLLLGIVSPYFCSRCVNCGPKQYIFMNNSPYITSKVNELKVRRSRNYSTSIKSQKKKKNGIDTISLELYC